MEFYRNDNVENKYYVYGCQANGCRYGIAVSDKNNLFSEDKTDLSNVNDSSIFACYDLDMADNIIKAFHNNDKDEKDRMVKLFDKFFSDYKSANIIYVMPFVMNTLTDEEKKKVFNEVLADLKSKYGSKLANSLTFADAEDRKNTKLLVGDYPTSNKVIVANLDNPKVVEEFSWNNDDNSNLEEKKEDVSLNENKIEEKVEDNNNTNTTSINSEVVSTPSNNDLENKIENEPKPAEITPIVRDNNEKVVANGNPMVKKLARAGFVKFPVFVLTLLSIGSFGIFIGKFVYDYLSSRQ